MRRFDEKLIAIVIESHPDIHPITDRIRVSLATQTVSFLTHTNEPCVKRAPFFPQKLMGWVPKEQMEARVEEARAAAAGAMESAAKAEARRAAMEERVEHMRKEVRRQIGWRGAWGGRHFTPI